MVPYAIRRLLIGLAVLFTISVVSFALTNAATDPAQAIAGQGASASDVAIIRHQYGFDRPVYERYLAWLGRAVQGDLGLSFFQKRPVMEIIAERLPVTMTLGLLALTFAVVLGIPLGVLAGLRPGSRLDIAALTFAVVGQALPTFWFGLLGVVLFSVQLGWLPASGAGTWKHYVLPAVTLGYYATPTLMRLTRSGMIDVLRSDYIRTARAKGLSMPKVVFRHALLNAVLPVISVAAVQFGFMLGGSVVIETIFALPGVGYLAWEGISTADLPVVQSIVLVVSMLYVVLTTASDIFTAALDPRVRLS